MTTVKKYVPLLVFARPYLIYTVRCQTLRFSRFKACFADCRDNTKRTNIEWGNVRSFHLSPLWGYQDLNRSRFGHRGISIGIYYRLRYPLS